MCSVRFVRIWNAWTARRVSPEDRLRVEAVLVLVGAMVHIVGRHLMDGEKGLIIAGVGFSVFWCGVVLYFFRGRGRSIAG
jgi:hypothetical protein